MKKKLSVFFVAVVALVFGVVGVIRADGGTGTVTVVHGVPGLTVDVYVNGGLLLPNFEPKTITDPVTLPSGDYDIDIYPAGADANTSDPAIVGSVFLPAGANASIVAHLAEDGTPVMTPFVNDVSPVAESDSRITVRHTAAAPAVDVILAKDGAFFAEVAGVSNGDEYVADIENGLYAAALTPAGSDSIIFGPVLQTLPAEFNRNYIAYAIGSIADGTFEFIYQSIDLDTFGTGVVTVVHGVPGLVVDVYVNGNLTLPGFQPLTVTDPLTLPEGTYEIEIYPAGADPTASAPAIAGSATLPTNANTSIVAHLTEAGAPTLSLFVNDTSSLGAGHARVAVRHTAAAPAVDVYASSGGQLLGVYEDLTNPNEIGGDLPAGSYGVAIAPANTQEFVFGPAEVAMPAQSSTIFYAVGSVADGSFAVIAQSIDLTD